MPCRAWGSHWPLWDWQRQVAEVRAPISYALSPATLETASNAGLEGVTELAEGVVVVIDRARPVGDFRPVGGFSFWRAPSLGSFSAQPRIAGEAPLGR